MEYGSIFFGCCLKTDLQKFESFQNSGLRTALRAFHPSYTTLHRFVSHPSIIVFWNRPFNSFSKQIHSPYSLIHLRANISSTRTGCLHLSPNLSFSQAAAHLVLLHQLLHSWQLLSNLVFPPLSRQNPFLQLLVSLKHLYSVNPSIQMAPKEIIPDKLSKSPLSTKFVI